MSKRKPPLVVFGQGEYRRSVSVEGFCLTARLLLASIVVGGMVWAILEYLS